MAASSWTRMSWNRSSSPGFLKDQYRTKRRLVTFNELPPNLVNAVTSIEDRRFFDHGGVDYFRLLGSSAHDLRVAGDGRAVPRSPCSLRADSSFRRRRRIKRKIIEIAITFQLENRFNKQQIFQLYANQIPLGQQGSFAINGFGQAAQTYFGKDVRQLNLAQCAMLAGHDSAPELSQSLPPSGSGDPTPQYWFWMRWWKRARSPSKSPIEAKAEPLKLAPINIDAGEAPYFVDLVRDRLVQHLGDTDFNRQGLRIYTSLDPDLQREATEAVTEGMKAVDVQVEKLHARRVKAGDDSPIVYPQVALVALNPHTGQVLALVGGRNYGASQFDHAVSNRPTGSDLQALCLRRGVQHQPGRNDTHPAACPQAPAQRATGFRGSCSARSGEAERGLYRHHHAQQQSDDL